MQPLTSFLPGQKASPALQCAALLACLYCTPALASVTFVDQFTSWVNEQLTAVRRDQPNRMGNPSLPLIGSWQDKVQVVVTSPLLKPGESDKYAYSWIGNISGTIDSSGKMRFRMDNGCLFEGNASSFASDNMWSADGYLDYCPRPELNRRVIGNVMSKHNRIHFSLYLPTVTQSPAVKVSVRTTLLERI